MRRPSGLAAAEKLGSHFAAEDGKRACDPGIVFRQKTTLGHPHLPDLGYGRPDTKHKRPPAARAILHRRIALDHRNRGHHPRQAFQSNGIVKTQRAHIADHGPRKAGRGGFARCNADEIGAELGKFRQDEAMDPLPERGQQHHGGNPHGNPQRGQPAAHGLPHQALEGKFGRITNQHLKIVLCANRCVGPSFQVLGVLQYACGFQ